MANKPPWLTGGYLAKWPSRRGTALRSEGGIDSQINVLKRAAPLEYRTRDPYEGGVIWTLVESLRLLGVGVQQAMADPIFRKLLLSREPGKTAKYLIALDSTARFYGWTKEFADWEPPTVGTSGSYTLHVDPGRRGGLQMQAGRRHYICRSPVKAGYPRGLTNAFKLSRNCGLLDLAELAHFTEGDWHWLTSPYGERIRRDQWERIYQSGIPGRRGVACSV